MSSTLEISIIKDGAESHFRSVGGGGTFDGIVFWGPDAVLHHLRYCQPISSPRRVAEGGAVVDFDRRILLWHGGEDVDFDPRLRQAFRTLMARNWRGWQERWAEAGAHTVAAYLGQEGSVLFEPVAPDRGVGQGLAPADEAQIREHLATILTVLGRELEFAAETDDEAAEDARRKTCLRELEDELRPR